MNKIFKLLLAILWPLLMYAQPENQKLSMKEAVDIAKKNNPEIKSAAKNISAARGRFWSGISLPQPEIGASYEYAPLHTGLKNFSERTLQASQSLEFPTRYFLKGKKLNKQQQMTSYELCLTERNVISQVKTSYCKVLARQYQVISAEENLAISADFFKKAEIRQQLGEGTDLERRTAKVQYTEAQNNLDIAQNDLALAFAELNYTLGFGKQNYDSNFYLTDSLVFRDYQIDKEKIFRSFDESNSQVKIAKLNYEIASVDKRLALSSMLPDINLAYFKQMRDGNNGFYGASFGISVPLWFMFDQRGKIQEASANKSISESELQVTRNEMALKLKSALTEHDNNLRQVRLYVNDILPQAEEIFKIALKSYDAGELTYLEYLQAKQTLINSRHNYISALWNHYQSVFRIEEIIGQDIIN